jgi:hypothetical protein
MRLESPEAVLEYILLNAHGTPQPSSGQAYNSDDYKRRVQMWFHGHLAADFDYGNLFMINMILRDEERSERKLEIPTARIIGNDAYIYMHDALLSFIRESDGIWKLRIALSMCWGCFGNHSFRSGQCWGVLCQCCGGTGWEGDTLEFCLSHEPPIDPGRIVETPSPRAAFIQLQKRQILMLAPLRDQKDIDITPALIRDDVAKIEVTTPLTRYLALMRNISEDQWQLNAFAPLCAVCGGEGRDLVERTIPCSACGGLKWGQAGELRYCRHTNSEWWTLDGSYL